MPFPVLLCFAHRGEAQTFISKLKLNQESDAHFNSYKNETIHMLITGEGPYSALPMMMAYLQKYQGQFSKILNFGIAAGIDSTTQVEHGYWVHSIYLEQENLDFNYHSYPCEVPAQKSTGTLKKLITVHRRVLSVEVAKKLSPVAELVDRESWALAMAAHFYKIPLQVYKVVSDQPQIEKEEFCQRIREKSLQFSEIFYKEYLKLTSENQIKVSEVVPSVIHFPTEIFLNPLFHFSSTQKHRYQNLFQKLQKKDSVDFKKIVLEQTQELSVLKVRPKDRTRLFLQNLENLINPLWAKMKQKIENDLVILNKAEIELHQDVTFESESCEISFQIESELDLENKISVLESFAKTDFWKKRQGQFDDL